MREQNGNNDQYIVHSVDNALQLLNLFSTYPILTISEISGLLGLNRTTAFRIVATLLHQGFLVKRDSLHYALGMCLLALGNSVVQRSELIQVFRPYTFRLATQINFDIQLVTWVDRCRIILLDKTIPGSTLQADSYLGRPKFAHSSSTGLALLAQKTDAEIEDYISRVEIKPITEYAISTKDELWATIAQIRKNNYALNDQMSEIGWMSIAVPVFDRPGNAIAAICASAPREHLLARRSEVVYRLQETAQAVRQSLI